MYVSREYLTMHYDRCLNTAQGDAADLETANADWHHSSACFVVMLLDTDSVFVHRMTQSSASERGLQQSTCRRQSDGYH